MTAAEVSRAPAAPPVNGEPRDMNESLCGLPTRTTPYEARSESPINRSTA